MRVVKYLGISYVATVAGLSTYVYKKSRLPDNQKFILAIDLDNTLIHAKHPNKYSNTSNIRHYDRLVNVDGDTYQVWIRPHADMSLNLLNNLTVMHLYTSAERDYAESVVTRCGWSTFFRSIIAREDNPGMGKDLSLIPGDNRNKCLVDDWLYNCVNGQAFYHIPAYKNYITFDFELLKLCSQIVYCYIEHDIKRLLGAR